MLPFLKTNAFTLAVLVCTLAYVAYQRLPMALADRTLMDRPAPPFQLQLLGGDTVELADYRGNWLLLNFWATWCLPCRVEMPQMDALVRELGSENFSLLSVSTEDGDTVRGFLREHPLKQAIALDPGGLVGDRFGVFSYPTLILVDKAGNIADISHGLDFFLTWKLRYRLRGSIFQGDD